MIEYAHTQLLATILGQFFIKELKICQTTVTKIGLELLSSNRVETLGT